MNHTAMAGLPFYVILFLVLGTAMFLVLIVIVFILQLYLPENGEIK